MKLSEYTITILKNFATINNNLLFKPGNLITTMSLAKNIIAEAKVEESFDVEFGIYDLGEFLGALGLFADHDIDFGDKIATIKNDRNLIKYFKAESEVLSFPPKEIVFPESDLNFKLTEAHIGLLLKSAAVLHAPGISFVGDGKKIRLAAGDKKSDTSNTFSVELEASKKKFQINLKPETFKFLPQDYDVSISSKKIARFVNGDLKYYITVEADSVFGE